MTRSRIALEGLPHSEIFGSKPVCGSPELIAAYHVLHRRPAPRHPPYALSSLTTTFTLLKTPCLRIYSRLSMPNSQLTSGSSVVKEPRATGPAFPRWLTPPIDARYGCEHRSLASAGGGAGRARTGDIRLAKAALSQLSYSPRRLFGSSERLVGLSGFEPLTSRLSAVRSSQLSYRPVAPQRPEARHIRIEDESVCQRANGRPGASVWLPEN